MLNKNIKPNNKKELIDVAICLVVVLALFIPTIFRPWLIYDERLLFDGLYFPTPSSIQELFEIIEKFGLNFNVISSNSMYSSNYVFRTCPFGQVFWLVINLLFQKKEPFLYHAFNLFLHLINTTLVYLILKNFLKDNANRFLTIILTLIWAVHPVMVESVLLTTNAGASFTYMIFFALLLDFLINRKNISTLLRKLIIPIIFLFAMLTNEYIVTLPLVLFVISFSNTYKEHQFKKAFKLSLLETTPYFSGLLLYTIYFSLFSNYNAGYSFKEKDILTFIERVFWLAPQIFFHMSKLMVFPKILSTDQTLFVNVGKTLLDPYSLFCIVFFFIWLFVPLFIFISKKTFSTIFLLTWTFFFALLPFLHILMPSYTLSAERYLYCPLLMFVMGLGKIISTFKTRKSKLETPVILFLSLILTFCFVRSYYRTLDWKDNFSFINSTQKVDKNNLSKALRFSRLANAVALFEPNEKEKAQQYYLQSLNYLKKAKKETLENKRKYQKLLPRVIKSYGIDYESQLRLIAYFEATFRCNELNEDYKIGLKILKPFMKSLDKIDPRAIDLYIHFLISDKNYKEAEDILLKANLIYPHMSLILLDLFDMYTTYAKDKSLSKKGENYLKEALKFYPYNTTILLKAIAFYKENNNQTELAKYSYLLGLRINSKIAYQESLAAYLNINGLNNARSAVKKLLKIDPNNPETLYFVSKYYYKTKDNQKALSYLKDAYKLSIITNSENKLKFDIAHTLARLYSSLGKSEEAILIAKDLFNLAKDNKENLIKLARLYKSLSLTEELKLCIEKIKAM